MAKIIHGGGAQVSGSTGATTYTRNGVQRRRSNPVNRNTASQVERRGTLATLSRLWGSGLTDIQRAAWEALGLTALNALGERITLNGFQAFMRINTVRAIAGQDPALDVPALPEFSGIAAVATVVFALAQLVMTISDPPAQVLVYATPINRPGRKMQSKDFRFLGVFTPDEAGVVTLTGAYAAVFPGSVLVEDESHIGLRTLYYDNGYTSPLDERNAAL